MLQYSAKSFERKNKQNNILVDMGFCQYCASISAWAIDIITQVSIITTLEHIEVPRSVKP